jgi:hypothetical protein
MALLFINEWCGGYDDVALCHEYIATCVRAGAVRSGSKNVAALVTEV